MTDDYGVASASSASSAQPLPHTQPQDRGQAHGQAHAHGHSEAHAQTQAKPQSFPQPRPHPGLQQQPEGQIDAEAQARAEAEVDRRLLESSLVRLRATGHPLLRSMADDLLAGRVSMRDLARNPDIAPPIQAAARRYLHWRNSMSEAELKAVSDDMAARVQWMRDQVAIAWRKEGRDRDRGGAREGEPESPPEAEGERGSHADR